MHAHARRRLPAGVSSNVKFYPPHPLYLTHAAGAHVRDADVRDCIDYCLSFGPLVAGHGHPRVVDAIRAELDGKGTTLLGGPSELELRLADRLAALIPSAEMVRLTSSGTEATLHALRLARGATGRSRVVKFEGHYHGVHDHVLWNLDRPLPPHPASDGIPGTTAAQTVVLPFNDLESVAAIDRLEDVAAVIVEPIARGVLAADAQFLRQLRDVTTRRGIVLVFDEIVVWPRAGLGGAQGLYGVTPDLTTLGKALGGGLPLGALVGRRDLMSLFIPRSARTPDDGSPYVFHGGTYNGGPTVLAAGLATLNLLEEPCCLAALDALGDELRRGLSDAARAVGVPLQVIGRGSLADFYFSERPIHTSRDVWASDLVRRRTLDYRLLAAGIHNPPLHRFHLSLAHTRGDLDRTFEAVSAALQAREVRS